MSPRPVRVVEVQASAVEDRVQRDEGQEGPVRGDEHRLREESLLSVPGSLRRQNCARHFTPHITHGRSGNIIVNTYCQKY